MGIEIELNTHFQEAIKAIEDHARERMEEAINEVRNETLETLSGNRSGRTYYVPGTHKTYTASAPGEPPAVATGHLRQNIDKGVELEDTQVVGYVGTKDDYGPMLEFGTKKMAPRPWLRISFEKSETKIKQIFTRKWF